MKGRAKVLLAVLVLAVFALVGCRAQPAAGIVGSWQHWEGLMIAEFTPQGEVTYYDCYSFHEPYPMARGTYELLSEDRIFIDAGYGPSGECTYEVQGVVLLLVNASGTRFVFNRIKESES
jgi:hypothetical protein